MSDNTNAGGGEPVTILYTNWRGETAVRRIDLSSLGDKSSAVGTLWYGSTQWHPEPQHFLTTLDVDKEEWRDFAMSGIKAWGQEAVDAALSAQSTGSAGVTAEPVAWAYDYQPGEDRPWIPYLSEFRPCDAEEHRNIRPLYEHPPVAVRSAAPVGGVAQLLNIAHNNGAAGFARHHQQEHPKEPVCLEEMHRAGMAEVVAAVEDMMTSLAAASAPPVAAEPVSGRWLNWRGAVEGYEASKEVVEKAIRQVLGEIDRADEAARNACWMAGLDHLWQHVEALRMALAAAPTPPAGGGDTMSATDAFVMCAEMIEERSEVLANKAQRELLARTLRSYAVAHSAPASPAGDLISLSARLHKLAHALWNDSDCRTDWSVEAMEIWKRLVVLTPAAPRKGPSEEEIAKVLRRELVARRDYDSTMRAMDWIDGIDDAAQKIAALLTPADRGETQAVDAADDLISGLGKPRVLCGSGDREFHVRLVYDDLDAAWNAHSALVRALAPSPDQNRGEPDQGEAITEAGR